MKNLLCIMLFVATVSLFTGCDDNDPDSTVMPKLERTPVRVEMKLKVNEKGTRAIDENLIGDVNIHLFGTREDYHFYYPKYVQNLVFEVLPGTYSISVTANVHKDMGRMTKTELVEYRYSSANMIKDLPMTADTKVNILGDTQLPAIELKRAAAKIAYTISVDPAVESSIKLRSVQFCNVPNTSYLYGTRGPSTSESNYYDDVPIDISNGTSYSDVYYMLENCQGEVASITDQKDKTSANAPA